MRRNKTTYSMEASMMTSWFTRNAAAHARGTAPTRCFDAPDRVECVRGSTMILSVITIRLSTRSTNLGFSKDDRDLSRSQYASERKIMYTGNDRRRYVPWMFVKYALTSVFKQHVCPGPRTIIALRIATGHIDENLRDNQVKFGEHKDYWH